MQLRMHVTILRNGATKVIWGQSGILPARRPNMRVMETLTGSMLSIATTVLAVGAILAF